MRLLLVHNSGSRLAGRVPRKDLVACLEASGAEVLDVFPDGPDAVPAAIAEAARVGCDRVVVAGGDGTVHPVLQALPGTGLALAVVPLGTGNVLAEELGLRSGDWHAACHVAAAGPALPMDLGLADGHYFAVNFGAGIDAQVVHDLGVRDKRTFGRTAFIGQLIRCMGHSAPARFTLTLSLNGEPVASVDVRAWAALVSNTPRYAWRLYFRPDARPDDGLLDLCVLAPRTRGAFLSNVALNFLVRRPVLSTDTLCRAFTSARIEADPPVHWQVDGESLGMTPVDVSIVPAAISVAVPPSRLRA
jgi:diacylglycerol kinase family enzyme